MAKDQAWKALEENNDRLALIRRGEAKAFESLIYELEAPEKEKYHGDIWRKEVLGRDA